ncbi:hypothetical protein BT96DRAFT_1026222 [Gymnopus androsaceus JB14]|uniref:C2H2-type domain-containing protein n=1 Tax=Gymnopus androsaceus JB14 TaxID=1447944 RepID=A0A6A4GMN6_9AGAR|nr:hypothetical protein BT96DRAFT_1026222 [Gymnopus androsaceus JB14]
MVRLNTEEELDNRKETTSAKKKAAAKKRNGIYPCGINGCTKQFAREADLKRHQKTAKQHAMVGFSCPQCEATFTRTDALRRHQKSRHSGVVFDHMEPEDDPNQPSRSNSADPSSSTSKGKEREMLVVPETVQGSPSASGPATGHSSYYRQNTAPISYSAPARTVLGAEWSSPNGSPLPPLGPTTYMYVPSPHHRHDTTRQQYSTGPASAHSEDDHTANSSSPSTSSSHSQSNDNASEVSSVPQMQAPIPPLPPPVQIERLLLETDSSRTAQTSSSDPCTQEGFSNEAFPIALKHTPSWSAPDDDLSETEDSNHAKSAASSNESSPTSQGSHIMREHGYGSCLKRPEPMEPILTEDGEPMLNPAELLTQVGWVALYDNGCDPVSDNVYTGIFGFSGTFVIQITFLSLCFALISIP